MKKQRRSFDDLTDDQWVDTSEVAAYTNYSPVHIRRLERAGKIPAATILGGRRKKWRFGAIRALGNN